MQWVNMFNDPLPDGGWGWRSAGLVLTEGSEVWLCWSLRLAGSTGSGFISLVACIVAGQIIRRGADKCHHYGVVADLVGE